MKDIDELNRTLESIKTDVSNLVEKSYNDGFQKAIGIELPTQEQCNLDHAEVLVYGEEGEWLVLGDQYNIDEAIKKFTDFLNEDGWGLDKEFMPKEENLYHRKLHYEMFEGEPNYVIKSQNIGGGLFDVWVFETQ